MAESNDSRPSDWIRYVQLDVVLAADDFVTQALHQGRLWRGHWGNDAHPVARQIGVKDRNRHDDPLSQARYPSVVLHHLGIGEDVGPANIERAINLGRQVGAPPNSGGRL